jgi:RNA polymerase sigma factor (TIGR02999 family)
MTTQFTDFLRGGGGPRDPDTARRLFELTYADLKRLARSNLRDNSNLDEMNTTVLVHESFLKYVEHGALEKTDRVAFFAYVGRVMRSVVIDFVRERQAQKRGGGQAMSTLTTNVGGESIDDEHLLGIHEAMTSLEKLAPQLHQLIEMRFFAGLSVPEVCEVTGQSSRTVEREWQKARALLRKLMDEA